MKALIVDNEPQIRDGLKKLIQNFAHSITSIFEADGIQSGELSFEKHLPDVLFLDVELDDGTGFELASKLAQKFKFQLVFITAHNKYAVEAFKLSAIDFLLKPIDPEDLARAVNKAKANLREHNLKEQIQVLQESLSSISSGQKKIVLRDSESIYFVKVSEIIRCEADGPYTLFYLNHGQKVTISKCLKEYESMLEPFGFVRIHHSHIVNSSCVLRFDKTEGGYLVLDNNEKIPVSNRKKEGILEILGKI